MEPSGPSPEPPAPAQACCGGGSLPIVLVTVAAIVGALLAANAWRRAPSGGTATTPASAAVAATDWTPSPRPAGETVSLAIDFGNGARREFAALPHRAGMTIGDLLRAAQAFRPAIAFVHEGEGEMAFLTSLEGVANEGGDGRYWIYRVDGATGTVSYDKQTLEPGAAVLWEFRRGE
jgi:hypothetical protein